MPHFATRPGTGRCRTLRPMPTDRPRPDRRSSSTTTARSATATPASSCSSGSRTPAWRAIDAEYVRGEIGSRVCLLDEWDLLPKDEAALRAAAREVALDPGAEGSSPDLRAAGAEVAIVSDGFGFYVHERLGHLGIPILTNDGRLGTRATSSSRTQDRCCACSSCGTCKQAPIKDAKRRGRTTVLVGDGASDQKAALLADVVFAKDGLARWC